MTMTSDFALTMTPPVSKHPPEDVMPEFDLLAVNELMADAKGRIQRLAMQAPGVWSWAKEHRAGKVSVVEQRKSEFQMSVDAKDLPNCHKWLYCYEQAAKSVIKEYMSITAKKVVSKTA